MESSSNLVRNPLTGRMITVGGQTYNNLLRQGHYPSSSKVVPKVTSTSADREVISQQEVIITPLSKSQVSDPELIFQKILLEEDREKNSLCTTCDQLFISRMEQLRRFN